MATSISASAPTSLSTLSSASSPAEFLLRLKDLKNGVIGNVWRKVEVAENGEVVQFLLNLLATPPPGLREDALETQLEIVQETAVIIGALANIGPLTLYPLLLGNVPARLLTLVSYLSSSGSSIAGITETTRDRSLAAILRALRNVLVGTADEVWGHMWGVGAERKVVGTGLEEVVLRAQAGASSATGGKGKGIAMDSKEIDRERFWDCAEGALRLPFEPDHLSTLLHLLGSSDHPQVLLPLYQLLARLVALPAHRESLIAWSPSPPPSSSTAPPPSPSLLAATRISNPRLSALLDTASAAPGTPGEYADGTSTPFILSTLLAQIALSHASYTSTPAPILSRRPNPKILEAILDLLASLVRGSPATVTLVRVWSTQFQSSPDPLGDFPNKGKAALPPPPWSASAVEDPETHMLRPRWIRPGVPELLSDIMEKGPGSVGIAAAGCITNLLKADESNRRKHSILRYKDSLLGLIGKVLDGEALEERIKISFVLAALASDDEDVQRSASLAGHPLALIRMLRTVEEDSRKGDLGDDPSARAKEAIILALASLCGGYEPTRSYLAELQPPFLPSLKAALGHPSYGVRAAACQLARALSRTVAILRTSLVDSGVGEEVIRLLGRECAARRERGERSERGDHSWSRDPESTQRGQDQAAESFQEQQTWGDDGRGQRREKGERTYTVEVAATAAICNLITDYSPLKSTLVNDGGLELLCGLSHSPHPQLALNALWAIKNLIFRESEAMKMRVVGILGIPHLKALMSPATPPPLRAQALEIVQNLLADASSSELTRTVDLLGEWELLDLVVEAGTLGDVEVGIPALYVLSNLALGNERLRNALVTRGDVLELLSASLDSPSAGLIIPALRTFRHLTESNVKTRKPRQGIVDLLAPYHLKSRLRALCDHTSLDVCHAAVALLDVLERAKEASGAR